MLPVQRHGLAREPRVGSASPVAVVLVAAMVVILWAGRGTTFLGDEWGWMFSALHPDANTFLHPDNGHLVAFTQVVYNVLLRAVGLGHYWVFRTVTALLHLVVAWLVFLLARPRIGRGAATMATALVALLGTGSDAFLGGINVGVVAAEVACLGALLALDVDKVGSDVGACLLLIAGLAAWTSAVAFTAGVAVELVVRRRVSRLWVALIPAVLYAAWRIHWAGGLLSGSGVSGAKPGGPLRVLGHMLQAATGAVSGLGGVQLMSPTLRSDLPWLSVVVQVAVGLGIAALAWRVVAGTRSGAGPDLTARLAGLVVNGLVLWLLLAIGRGSLGNLYASRYVYMGEIVVALIAVELLAGRRWRPRAARLAATAVALAIALNVGWMVVWGNHLRQEATVARAQLAALDIAGQRAPADLAPAASEFALAGVTAGRYLEARATFGGSPADTVGELLRAPEPAREQADGVLAHALGVGALQGTGRAAGAPPLLEAAPGAATTVAGSCLVVAPRSAVIAASVTVRSPGVALAAGQGRGMLIVGRRFASRFTIGVGGVAGGSRATVPTPGGGVPVPWHLRLYTAARASVCSSGS